MLVYAVIGDPIFHSLSPLIHRTLYEIYHIDAAYLPIQLNKRNLKDFLDHYAAALDLQGFNVTMPLKQEVISVLDHLDDASAYLQSVNTVDWKTKTGFTTDGLGFLHSINRMIKDKHVVLIGAGGAAKSIAFTVNRQSPASFFILNRTIEKAQELASTLDRAQADYLSNIGQHMENCDILINASSLGMANNPFEDLAFVQQLPQRAMVYDIIYNPRETALLKAAKDRGLAYQNGIDMLIWQAFYSFEIFFGIMPTEADKEKVLERIGEF